MNKSKFIWLFFLTFLHQSYTQESVTHPTQSLPQHNLMAFFDNGSENIVFDLYVDKENPIAVSSHFVHALNTVDNAVLYVSESVMKNIILRHGICADFLNPDLSDKDLYERYQYSNL